MKITCDYCGNNINSTDEKCPHCGAPNSHIERVAQGVPKTIEELSAYFAANGISESKTRFFVGKDVKEARAFGIYKDENGLVTVYKNKSDGSRAVRYQGTDEAYAVNEIYQKFVEERSKQIAAGNVTPKGSNQHRTSGTHPHSSRRKKGFFGNLFTPRGTIYLIIFVLIMIYALRGAALHSHSSYNSYYPVPIIYDSGYDYDDYDSYGDSWYSPDDYDSSSDSYWSDDSSWDSGWDSDWDSGYDYDSWDSDWDTDWDSDW